MTSYYFKITDITIRMDVYFSIGMTENYSQFLVEETEHPDEKINIYLADTISRLPDSLNWKWGTCCFRTSESTVILHRLAENPPYLAEYVHDSSLRNCVYAESSGERPDSILKIFNNLELESILLRHQALILHCSFICWHGKGVLFSAPSGTGKSTQADLWALYEQADILNGDRAGIRYYAGKWTAYGLPYAGSSGIYRNISAPLSAIVLLEQAQENSVDSVTPSEAFHKLLPQFTIHQWDPGFVNRSIDIISMILKDVPVYRLRCRPDQDAVCKLRNMISCED